MGNCYADWLCQAEADLRHALEDGNYEVTITGGNFMALKRGNVVLVPFLFSDLSTTKVNPAIVMTSSHHHATNSNLILARITSRADTASGLLDYVQRDWQATGLHHPSAVKPVLFTFDPTRMIYHVGTLTPPDLVEVDQRLRHALEF